MHFPYSNNLDYEIKLSEIASKSEVSLGDVIKSKKGLVFLTYLGCQPCKPALPMVQSLFDSAGINVISINLIDKGEFGKLSEYIKLNQINYPY